MGRKLEQVCLTMIKILVFLTPALISVLDDNKLLTLPNGERLNLPPNVRVMFEVEHLRYATLATVSRCGMIWFSDEVVNTSMLCRYHLDQLIAVPVGSSDDDSLEITGDESSVLALQRHIVSILEPRSMEEYYCMHWYAHAHSDSTRTNLITLC